MQLWFPGIVGSSRGLRSLLTLLTDRERREGTAHPPSPPLGLIWRHVVFASRGIRHWHGSSNAPPVSAQPGSVPRNTGLPRPADENLASQASVRAIKLCRGRARGLTIDRTNSTLLISGHPRVRGCPEIIIRWDQPSRAQPIQLTRAGCGGPRPGRCLRQRRTLVRQPRQPDG